MHFVTETLTTLLAFVVALGVIIYVHEMGHLLAAKLFGVRVEVFSLGFGPRLWGLKRGETDYRISAVPLGGYVKLGGELPDEGTGDPREFLSKPRWQRIIVYLAGPAMNVVLAIVLIAGVFMVGTEIPDLPDLEPVIGEVAAEGAGAAAGLAPGDRVLAVDGEEVDNWSEVAFALATSPGRPVRLTVEREGARFEAEVTPAVLPRYQIGDAGLMPVALPRVIRFTDDSPAREAGLLPGDQLLSVDGRPVTSTRQFIDYVQERPGAEIVLGIRRRQDGAERELEIAVVTADTEGRGKIGIYLGFYQRYGPIEAFYQSARYNVQIVGQTFAVLKKIVTREMPAKGALAGPIEIAIQAGAAARVGIRYLVHLMGFISISIAIVNLLPIPVLDGGQISVLLVESAMRRDLSIKLKERISQFGFVVILALMLVVIYFDFSKNWPF